MHMTASEAILSEFGEELSDRLFSLMREISALPVEARFRYALHVASNLVEGVGLAGATRIESRVLADLLLIATQLDELSCAIKVDPESTPVPHLRLC
jgi:hypothetical protein